MSLPLTLDPPWVLGIYCIFAVLAAVLLRGQRRMTDDGVSALDEAHALAKPHMQRDLREAVYDLAVEGLNREQIIALVDEQLDSLNRF